MTDIARRTGPALEAHQQFILWLVPTIERFPRSQKFLLGDRLQATALDVLEALIEATYTRDRRGHLARANLGLEKLRVLCRLATELRHLDPRRYQHAARSIDEIGRPGRYVEIKVRDPKERIVSAAPFRDRVVHHALCAVISPLFERGFIGNTFANRTGKGTHRAIAAYESYRDRHAHVLRCDLFRYFPSIDHAILKAGFRRRIACERTLALMDAIVDGSNPQEPVDLHFPGDDLFAPYRRRRGLPIGNLTSQFFANLYLDGFDHFATEVLRAPYLRYVDDFALFHDDPATMGSG